MVKRKQNMPRLSELNLTDRFLFDEVMEDAQTHQDVLSIIFGKDIQLHQNETEKELRKLPSSRSVRMDVFAVDDEQNIYNTGMQSKKRADLSKRSRYYQSMIDTTLLTTGIPDYNILNTSYIIMIMPFDLFGYDRYCYTFAATCLEEPNCHLGDGAYRIFLNTRGKNDTEVSAELVEFLHYVEHSTDEVAQQSSSEALRRIHNRVCKVKSSEEVGVRYMQAWEERYYDKQEAREEGLAEGRREGEKRARVNILRHALENGMGEEQLRDWLGATEEELEEVCRNLEKE